MRNFLALLAATFLLFVGLGWYLGWYRVQSHPAPDGERRIDIELNTKKITEDVGKAGKKAKAALNDFLDDDQKAKTVVAPKQVNAQPTGFRFNEDGSVTYEGSVKIPVVPQR